MLERDKKMLARAVSCSVTVKDEALNGEKTHTAGGLGPSETC